MKPTTDISSPILPCSSYDHLAKLAILDGSEQQDVVNKNIFFYTFFGNYGIEHTHDYWEFILVLSGITPMF